MEVTSLLAIAILAVVFVAMLLLLVERVRGQSLRRRFGAEYDHTLRKLGSRRAAEEDLRRRTERVKALAIRPLEPGERDRFIVEWRDIQSRFVDAPREALMEADRLTVQVMDARGYPVGEFEQRAADISVDHPHVVDHYRSAHRVTIGGAGAAKDTEGLRQAMIHYRARVSDLLEVSEAETMRRTPTAAPVAPPPPPAVAPVSPPPPVVSPPPVGTPEGSAVDPTAPPLVAPLVAGQALAPAPRVAADTASDASAEPDAAPEPEPASTAGRSW